MLKVACDMLSHLNPVVMDVFANPGGTRGGGELKEVTHETSSN